jgi:ABC-type transporter Mla maintaining outer membrane lipid asymmetry ATPase subunit MlaF
MESPQLLIEMLDVAVASVAQPEVAQVEHVTWRIEKDQFWILGGLQASGKSNLLATAAGLQNPLRGIVKLFGREASALREKDLAEERQRIGLVFENGGRTFSRLTVSENVALPLRYHADLSEAEVESELHRLLEPMELVAFAHHPARVVSHGMQQRTALARALTLKPEVLFLDQPLSSVEVREHRWWLEFLPKLLNGKALKQQPPITLVLTTADLQPWVDIGTHFAVLKNNRWQFLGKRAELKSNQEQLRELWADEFLL